MGRENPAMKACCKVKSGGVEKRLCKKTVKSLLTHSPEQTGEPSVAVEITPWHSSIFNYPGLREQVQTAADEA